MCKKRPVAFFGIHLFFIVASVSLLLMSCSSQPSFFTPDKIRELENRLAAAGITASCSGENYANQRGQGIGLDMDRKPSRQQGEVIKSVVEQYLLDNGVTKYTHIGVFVKQDGFPIIIIAFDPRVTQPRTGAQNKPASTNSKNELASHFESANLSFDYPKEWLHWEKESFNRIKDNAKAQSGADLLVFLKNPDATRLLQIIKAQNQASFDSFYKTKKEFADEVSTKGMDIAGFHYNKYTLEKVQLLNGQNCLLGYAEKQNGEIGISYQFLSDGYEVDVNFLYQSVTSASKDEKLRDQIMQTFKIIGMKTKKTK
jgi:hypothetical protein